MDSKQEPKYKAEGGRIFNRSSGEQIPDEEPVFILRARDTTAIPTLLHYYLAHLASQNTAHAESVLRRVHDFQQFLTNHPDRMKYPDTDSHGYSKSIGMNMQTLRLETREGDRVLWVPSEAEGNVEHFLCKSGIITRFDDKRVMMKFDEDVHSVGWESATEVAIDPRTLRVL